MAIRNATQKNRLAQSYATGAPYLSLHTGDPGTTGAATSEVTGGSPAYARVAANWGTASNGVVTSGSATFNVPSGSTVAYVGFTTAGTAATADVQDSVAVTSQAFASQGTYTVTATYTQS